MKTHKTETLALALIVIGATSGVALYAQQHTTVNSPTAIHEQTARHAKQVARALATLSAPETAFDLIDFTVSGPVVLLQGFTINEALKSDAEKAVKRLKWVTFVVNKVELMKEGPEARRVRLETLATLQKRIPQAFPENAADIRIKVTVKGDVTLFGVIMPKDHERLLAAINQIKASEFVHSVTNSVVERTT